MAALRGVKGSTALTARVDQSRRTVLRSDLRKPSRCRDGGIRTHDPLTPRTWGYVQGQATRELGRGDALASDNGCAADTLVIDTGYKVRNHNSKPK